MYILEVPEHYKKLKNFLGECTASNIQEFKKGDRIPFDPKLTNQDDSWEALTSKSPHDATVSSILFKSYELLLDWVLADHQLVLVACCYRKRKQC